MLIRFKVKNYLSFRDEQELSLVPGRGTLLKEHKANPIKGISVLKSAVVFGANAGGKSNLVKAIAAGKAMLLRGLSGSISILKDCQYRLDEASIKGDSHIEYEIQVGGKNYCYGFEFNNQEIKEEWLVELNKRGCDTVIYERRNVHDFSIDYLLKKNKKEEARQFLQFLAKATPEDQLFLHEVMTRKIDEDVENIDDLKSVIDWFKETLKIIFPDQPYKQGVSLKAANDEELKLKYTTLLQYFDTGIESIDLIAVEIEKLGLPTDIINDIKEDLSKDKNVEAYGSLSANNDLYLISVVDGQIIAKKLVTIHRMNSTENKETMFPFACESDGTKRLFDYIPLILDLVKGNKVFIVDEIERSLHPNLIKRIFKLFFDNCEVIDSQLIVTTHESQLMNQKLLRKDEIWFVNRTNGGSTLTSLEEYKVRFDKELLSSFLDGCFEGVPVFKSNDTLRCLFDNKCKD